MVLISWFLPGVSYLFFFFICDHFVPILMFCLSIPHFLSFQVLATVTKKKAQLSVVLSRENLSVDYSVKEHGWVSEFFIGKMVKMNGN